LRIPSSLIKKFFSITIKGAFIELSFHFNSSSKRFGKMLFLYKLRDFIYGCKIKINRDLIFDTNLYSEDFHVKLDSSLIQNQDLEKILNINLRTAENLVIIVPNKFNITSGKHKITLNSEVPKLNVVFKTEVPTSTEEIVFPPEQNVEKILQKSESLASYEQDAEEFQNKIVNIGFIIVLLIYLPPLLYFFGLFLFLLLDPGARVADAGLGPGITLIVLIGIGICFLPNFKKRMKRSISLRKKKYKG